MGRLWGYLCLLVVIGCGYWFITKKLMSRQKKTQNDPDRERGDASHEVLHEQDVTYLGTIKDSHPDDAEKPEVRVYRSKRNEKEYCLVEYISGAPVHKDDFSSERMELKLKAMLRNQYKNVNREQIVRILEQEFPMSVLRLADLSSSESENVPLPQLTEEEKATLAQLSEQFFGDADAVIQKPSMDPCADRLLAAELLVQFMASAEFEDFPYRSDCGFIKSLETEKNRLRLILNHWETSCYDGGAGGTWDHYRYADLERLDEDWSFLCAEYGLSEGHKFKVKNLPSYRGTFPGDDCECLIRFWCHDPELVPRCDGIYLLNPFGVQGIYRFWIHSETY